MPNRVIRQGFLDSVKINAMSEECQNFFIRLALVVDDYGRFDARPELLKSQCYPVSDKRLTDVSKMLAELKSKNLINLYSVNNKQYLEIIDFNQRLRQKRERFPAYCGQLSDNSQTDVSLLHARMPESESESETESESESETEIALNKIEDRSIKFLEEINTFKQYETSMLNEFYDYWSEPNKSKTKMRWELQPTWDLKRRLKTWADRQKMKPQQRYGRQEVSREELKEQFDRIKLS